MVPTADPFSGTPYRIVRALGEGGMGEVYEVEHELVGKLMVAKILRPELATDAAIVDRMRVEAQSLAALSHPNIVNVTDFHRAADGRPFYVMERLRGVSLGAELRRRGSFPPEEAIEIGRQVLHALAAAHALGLVHRDIKLDNVFLHVRPDGEQVVKVLDFGVAKVLSGARGPRPLALPTAEGTIVGTPRWVSPEQARGKDVDHRADIYAVGLLLYALVAGRGPFDHMKRAEDLLIAHLEDLPEPPSKFVPTIPEELDAAILRALRKAPGDRFQSANDFERVIGAIASRGSRRSGAIVDPPNASGSDARAESIAVLPGPAPLPTRTELCAPQEDLTAPSPAGWSRTELLSRGAGSSAASLDTRTASRAASETEGTTAVGDQGAVSPPGTSPADTAGSNAKMAYAAAGVGATIPAALGVWLFDARSVLGLGVVFLSSSAAAALAAWLSGKPRAGRR